MEDWAFLEPMKKVSLKTIESQLEDLAFLEPKTKISRKTKVSQWKTELYKNHWKNVLPTTIGNYWKTGLFKKSLKKSLVVNYTFFPSTIGKPLAKLHAESAKCMQRRSCTATLVKLKWRRNLIALPSAILTIYSSLPCHTIFSPI